MAKKKAVRKAVKMDMVDFVGKQLPSLSMHAATLMPFDDVISGYGVRAGDGYFNIDIDCCKGVWPSGDHDTYGARIYADRVVMFQDTHSEDSVYREECATTLAGLWSFLRQLPRPMQSFGEWQPLEGE